ncbi:hypothetical protein [Namhaeicola litoreus]|uniref:Glycosyltransferase subfamily 4-like N-terminal domain-containing protein n=1 Tax=Namhaeicola litoreus TaxID=1052145 RepID=A0ABW3Y3V1_9FLAO
MKILIISRSFYPMNTPRAFRTTELVKEFSRIGHEVTLYTHMDNKQKGFKKKYKLNLKVLPTPRWKTPNLGTHKIPKLVNRAFYRILSNYLDFPSCEYYFLVKNALKNEKNYDLLISIAIPHTIHWGVAGALRVNKNLTKTWIADCGDPYLIVENDTFQKPFYFKYLERWWAKRVDFITVPVQGAIKAYNHSIQTKIKVIPQGFNFDEIKTLVKGINRSYNKVPTFIYGGGFIPNNRDPRQFLEYLNSLKVNFKFYVYTNKLELVQYYADKSQNRIEIFPIISRNEFLKVLVKMDFVVNFENKGNNQVPSKLIDYAILNKPILSVSSQDIPKATIDNFLKGNYEDAYIVANVENYNIKNVVENFLSLHEYNDKVKKS